MSEAEKIPMATGELPQEIPQVIGGGEGTSPVFLNFRFSKTPLRGSQCAQTDVRLIVERVKSNDWACASETCKRKSTNSVSRYVR